MFWSAGFYRYMKEQRVRDELRALFESEGLMRYTVIGDERGEVAERSMGPLVAMGPRDEDYVWPPDPSERQDTSHQLHEWTLKEYNTFLYRWLEAAARAGDLRCANCGKVLREGEDLKDTETWDAIFVEKELVAWMAVHFDCKRWLAKKLKGMHPFDLQPVEPPHYDLSEL